MANHLFIGLGGTGGRILREMRKRVYEEFDSNTPQGDIHLEYIYVDSDEKDLYNDEEWNHLGADVSLGARQKVNIHGIGSGVLASPKAFPGIGAFINDDDLKELRSDQVSGIIDAGIGGQRRRFGRLLLANNVTNSPDEGFTAVVRERLLTMRNGGDGQAEVVIHICAGLAGGTGSGSIVDAVAQIHKITQGENGFDVFLYLYVPENMVSEREDKGFYHANGYAALAELNAIALGKYHPVDISGERDPRNGKVKRLINGGNAKPFKRAYLFSNINEDNHMLKKDDRLPAAIADFLYQKTVAVRSMGNQLQRVLDAENSNIAPEKDAANNPVHARDFISFGIIRVQYPEAEIKAYTTEKTTVSTLGGLISNAWIDRRGFATVSDEEAGIGFMQEVRQPATQQRLLLEYDYLTLQQPVADFAGTEDWQTYDEYWNTYCTFFGQDVTESHRNYRDWVAAFDEIIDIEYNSNFRSQGVHHFFATQKEQKEVKRYAAVLCKHIEKTLFEEWVNGRHGEGSSSLQKTEIFLTELVAATRERIPKISEIKATHVQDRDSLIEKLKRLADSLSKTGKFGNFVWDTAKRVFQDYVKTKAELNAVKTKIEACDFADLLLKEMVSRLQEMSGSVLLLQNMMKEAMATADVEAENSCKVKSQASQNDVEYVDERYDPADVRQKVDEDILADETLQCKIREKTLESFKKLAQESGKPALFRAIYDAMGGVKDSVKDKEGKEHTKTIIEFMRRQSFDLLKEKINKMAEDEENKKLLGVNILERIRQEFPTTAAQKSYLADLKRKAKSFLQFNEEEFGKSIDGQPVSTTSQHVQICVPEFKEPFRSEFIQMIRDQYPDTIFSDKSIAGNDHTNEMVFIMLRADFPLRFVQNVKKLREKYEEMVSEHNPQGKLNRVLLHTETLPDGTLPCLFEESEGNVRRRVMLSAIKAHLVPGLIEEGEDPDNGRTVYLINIGTRMDEIPCYVGKNVLETAARLTDDARLRQQLTAYIDHACDEAFRGDSGRQQLAKKAEDFLFDEILPLCGGNKLSEMFKEYKEVTKDLIKSLS
ncbi:MAG: hypothetical protein IJ615_06530 [Bacteroidaceae bacterium]|nr:hypothetical protein [Bacteroidaceae bacterium]